MLKEGIEKIYKKYTNKNMRKKQGRKYVQFL